jgi:calcineurin-like phosphoesterase family protein
MIYFTSDLHFRHKNILTIGKGRPFGTVEEMEGVLIKNWNKKVNPTDDIYVLGDVFWGQNSEQIRKIMAKLNGIKHLIVGNHDRIMPNEQSGCWNEIVHYKEIIIDKQKVVLSHYPIFEWCGYYYGSYHFYGHTHGSLDLSKYTAMTPRPNLNCWDVGVDNNNFEPVSFEEICKKIEKRY